MIVRRAERLFDQLADRRPLKRAAIVPAALMHRPRKDANIVHRYAQAEPMQQPRGVGADLNARANLADPRRLLMDLDVDAGVQEMQRGRQTADAAADNDRFHCNTCRHTARPSRHPLPRQATCMSGRTSTRLAS